MEDRKMLTGMLLVALVVSVIGSIVTVDRLGNLNGVGITGAATGEGSGDLNISQDLTITLTDSAIEFGEGNVDPGSTFAALDSGSGLMIDGTWANNTDFIVVRNDGNIGLNVTVQSNKKSGNHPTDSFICQNDVGTCGGDLYPQANATRYSFKAFDDEAGSCVTHGVDHFSVINTEYDFCRCLRSGDQNDQVKMSLIVGVPDNAAGDKEATITFTSSIGDVSC